MYDLLLGCHTWSADKLSYRNISISSLQFAECAERPKFQCKIYLQLFNNNNWRSRLKLHYNLYASTYMVYFAVLIWQMTCTATMTYTLTSFWLCVSVKSTRPPSNNIFLLFCGLSFHRTITGVSKGLWFKPQRRQQICSLIKVKA